MWVDEVRGWRIRDISQGFPPFRVMEEMKANEMYCPSDKLFPELKCLLVVILSLFLAMIIFSALFVKLAEIAVWHNQCQGQQVTTHMWAPLDAIVEGRHQLFVVCLSTEEEEGESSSSLSNSPKLMLAHVVTCLLALIYVI